MITYTCNNLDKDGKVQPCTGTICKTSTCPTCGQRTDAESKIYWCKECNIPLYEDVCSNPEHHVSYLTTDLRPVFPEERLLLEVILEKPFVYKEASVWNGTGNKYFIDGKKIEFSISNLKFLDYEKIRTSYQELKEENSENAFDKYINLFIKRNQQRYQDITEEATSYVRHATENCSVMDMMISFSGGKDSTVTADLVTRALSNPKILHIFGDTTLEFPLTYEYVERYKKAHPKTPILSSRNKDKDFEELCKVVGPPSRVMRWCCTIFKTGSIQRKINTMFRKHTRIYTFYGIRRSESASRSKYDRESDSPKITKQKIISPVIDWMDFDIWLYLLTTGIDFNDAYRLGYARVGCWCCPNNSRWSEFLSKIHMPKQAEAFRNMLIDFAKGIGKPDPEDYVDDGFWKARQGGNGVAYAKKSIVEFKPCATEENAFNYELQKPITEELYELFRPFGYLNFDMGNKRLGEVFVLNAKDEILLKLQGRIGSKRLKVSIMNPHLAGAKDLKTAEERVKCQLTKYQMCIGCLACESVCRFRALEIKEQKSGEIQYRISDVNCKRCGECVGHFTAGCYMRKVLMVKRE